MDLQGKSTEETGSEKPWEGGHLFITKLRERGLRCQEMSSEPGRKSFAGFVELMFHSQGDEKPLEGTEQRRDLM